MQNFKKYFIAATAALAFVSCSSDDDNPASNNLTLEFNNTFKMSLGLFYRRFTDREFFSNIHLHILFVICFTGLTGPHLKCWRAGTWATLRRSCRLCSKRRRYESRKSRFCRWPSFWFKGSWPSVCRQHPLRRWGLSIAAGKLAG